MLYWFCLFSLIFGLLSYINLDPMKSSFFLIFSLLSSMPLLSMSMHVWYSYFICLLFLSGIFVILVYFSSLSKINLVKSHGFLICLMISLFFMTPCLMFLNSSLGMTNFYYNIYWFQFIYVMLVLLFFMNFSSYFLNFSGALRKV